MDKDFRDRMLSDLLEFHQEIADQKFSHLDSEERNTIAAVLLMGHRIEGMIVMLEDLIQTQKELSSVISGINQTLIDHFRRQN